MLHIASRTEGPAKNKKYDASGVLSTGSSGTLKNKKIFFLKKRHK